MYVPKCQTISVKKPQVTPAREISQVWSWFHDRSPKDHWSNVVHRGPKGSSRRHLLSSNHVEGQNFNLFYVAHLRCTKHWLATSPPQTEKYDNILDSALTFWKNDVLLCSLCIQKRCFILQQYLIWNDTSNRRHVSLRSEQELHDSLSRHRVHRSDPNFNLFTNAGSGAAVAVSHRISDRSVPSLLALILAVFIASD